MVGGQPDTMLAILKKRRKILLFLPAKCIADVLLQAVAYLAQMPPETAQISLLYGWWGNFPDMLMHLAETAVILVVSHRKAVTVTSSAVTVTFRSTKRKFLPSL